MQFIQFQSQNPNSLTTPSAGNFNVFIDQTDNTLKVKDQAGEVYGGGGGFSDTTYSELVSMITTSGLTAGGFYLITDFRTCYDQPDFDYNNNSLTEDNYKQSAVQPIMVFATSVSTISVDAYQPAYPNDKIQYDWTFSATEVTNEVAYGRISERIDEFNNRTDYDHRTILFKRYRLYTYRDQRLNGTIELLEDGTINGTNTSFTALTVGDVIYVPNVDPSYYEITEITDDFEMFVSGDTIGTNGSGLEFYMAIEESNGNDGYLSYKRTNVKTSDFIEYTTFGDAILENYAKNNYVGNLVNNYTEYRQFTFLLANNVFLKGECQNNKFGDYCYNNTFGNVNSSNVWGDWCYENVSTSNNYNNIIGNLFYENLINNNLISNHIGNEFYGNRLLFEDNNDFSDNIIGNGFNNNIIYSPFYDNEILNDFNDNTIGDFGNINNFEFYRNIIGNDFNENIIRQTFQNNRIGNQYRNNNVNGEFYKNVIGNGFNSNDNIGADFNSNYIGNGFNDNNLIGDNFYNNKIDDYFENNWISYGFNNNEINYNFNNNTLGDIQYFNWNSTTSENLNNRTYNTFYDALGRGQIGNRILGKEFIMHDTNNDEYHKVKFTQWTQGGNGGGFSYERTKVYPTQEDTVFFTKTNYGSEVDIIVEGSLEITRDNGNGAIYNRVDEEGWSNNQSPLGTEWNSIYTQFNNGKDFRYNKIGTEFYSNQIGINFQTNQISILFNNNTIGDNFGFGYTYPQGNKIGNNFYNNNVGEYFYNNVIPDNFTNNEIGNYFQWNNVQALVQNTTLSSCALYSGLTVNVFQNANGDNRLSYYDESDVLTIESLTEECPVISFTITSGDFSNGGDIDGDTTALGVDGVDGFENYNVSPDTLYDGYYGQGLGGDSLSELTAAYNALGLPLDNSTGYVWNVTWGEGSTIESGLVKFGAYINGVGFNIQTIDPTDTNWQTPNSNNGTSLVGTFLFPATFTAYLPLINKSGWC